VRFALDCLVHYPHLLPLLFGKIADSDQVQRDIILFQFLADDLQLFDVLDDGGGHEADDSLAEVGVGSVLQRQCCSLQCLGQLLGTLESFCSPDSFIPYR
jgi:hypothetical protein